MKKLLKKMTIAVISIIAIFIIAYLLFVNFNPVFGGNVSKELQAEYVKSKNYKNGKFHNIGGIEQKMTFDKTIGILKQMLFEKFPNAKPKKELPILKADSTNIANYKEATRLLWFGHSAFLLQTNNKNILIDPMLTEMPSPISRDAQRRFNKEIPIEIEQLPKIDVILISHDHYDHLDYESIKRLKNKVAHYIVPLGVSTHLKAWGIPDNKITELDWWQEIDYKNIKFVCTPSQHFSGRRFENNGSTLWSSWVIKTETDNLFFSGDSGYNSHFKEIGNKYGPFDLALMECGQYNKMWPEIHMMPEETVQAGIDVQAKKMMPIHWGAFRLAMHDWNDPVIRVSKKAAELNLPLVVPKIGEPIIIEDKIKAYSTWWNNE
ncbi:MBL fold metallo-hydrolase [Tenacibaculum aiptasiae]|uniref:MBL fold metallo-hydrolase n=1 Tax=Tenacibaculum aiptasiae TaxID=426481 RepID=UPI003B59D882